MSLIQNYINHIVFVIDKSGSMRGLSREVVKVFDEQISHLATRSKEMNQETRVSVYLFNQDITCLLYDMDVMRLPSIAKHYLATGNTALIDATIKASDDLSLTPEIYADHAFLVYVLTDGQENSSKNSPEKLKLMIETSKDNWTFACLVPDPSGRRYATSYGFPLENTQIWSTTSDGVTKVGEVIRTATDNYMLGRSQGIRSTKSLFQLNTNTLNTKAVKVTLDELPINDFEVFPVQRKAVIQPFVESWTSRPYRKGSAYFQLTKPESVQNYKQILVQEKTTGKVYSGANARQLLGLPDYEVKVSPASHDKYNIFIQSTSVNRNLVPGTLLIVLK